MGLINGADGMTAAMPGIHQEKEGRRRKEGRKESVCVKIEKKAPSQHVLSELGLPCGRGTCHLVMQVVKNSNKVVSKQTVWGG